MVDRFFLWFFLWLFIAGAAVLVPWTLSVIALDGWSDARGPGSTAALLVLGAMTAGRGLRDQPRQTT